MVRGLNSSFIVLIPKKDNPQKIEKYRLISPIGCMYKVLTKILANWLRKVTNSVISESQSAFIKGRRILDGVFIANKLVDEAKQLKKEGILFKVYFEKAYDLVNWEYLMFVLIKMGFSEKWMMWITKCLSFVSMGRGLHQGSIITVLVFDRNRGTKCYDKNGSGYGDVYRVYFW